MDWLVLLRYYFGNVIWLLPVLACALFLWRSRRIRFVMILLMIVGAASLTETWWYPHYAAPFAAALQDYNRALIVGDQNTFGKGTVQTMLEIGRIMPFLGSGNNEAGVGGRCIQYVHYPSRLRPRPPADLRWYHAAAPLLGGVTQRVADLPGCGHVPMSDDPDRVAEVILATARRA